MIRVVAFLVVTALLALGVVWLADRPGTVTITWLGHRTDTSVMVDVRGDRLIALATVVVVVAAARTCSVRRSCFVSRCANASAARATMRCRAA